MGRSLTNEQKKIRLLFKGRRLIVATMHKKEQVIAPVLEKTLAVKCFVDPVLDTDSLGTFTGEIERESGVIQTARRKCQTAMELTGCDIAIASEGSFGPHPQIGLLNADDEVLMFVDKKNGLEIVVRELSFNTNFSGEKVKTEAELLIFAEKVLFPTHALAMRKALGDHSDIVKGICDEVSLKNTFAHFKARYGSAYVETDMRALFNPTRMKVIRTAAGKLAERISSLCPSCDTPGFGVTQVKHGLPCSMCGFPTKSTLSLVFQCTKCAYVETREFPHQKTTEDPTFCDYCNP